MNYIVFDLEATCWQNDNTKSHEIIEIGAVKIVDNIIVDEYQTFVKPVVNPILSPFCTKLTSITQEDVQSAPIFARVLPEFVKWISDNGATPYWLCSWGFYDKKMFKSECGVLNVSTTWLKNHISIKHQFATIKNIKPCGMAMALEFLDIPLDGTHHRGIDDARNIAKIFLKIFDSLTFKV
jgi:3'-5' exoribonuclease 1